jgi:hypothetical protein
VVVGTTDDVGIRRAEEGDTEELLALLQASFPRWPQQSVFAHDRPLEFFRWKHLANPAGPSLIMIGEAAGRIVAMRAYMPWPLMLGREPLGGRQGVDVATEAAYRGRGINSAVVRHQIGMFSGAPPMTLGLPNRMSKSQSTKFGHQEVKRVPLWIRVRRPLRVAGGVRRMRTREAARPLPPVEAPAAARALREAAGVEELLRDRGAAIGGYRTAHDLESLAWRYEGMLGDYRAIVESGEDGKAAGIAIFRLRRRRGALVELSVCELFVRPGDSATARTLLRRVGESAPADHVAAAAGPGLDRAVLARAGFVRSSVGGTAFGLNVYGREMRPDPLSPEEWSLSLGDIERLQLC